MTWQYSNYGSQEMYLNTLWESDEAQFVGVEAQAWTDESGGPWHWEVMLDDDDDQMILSSGVCASAEEAKSAAEASIVSFAKRMLKALEVE